MLLWALLTISLKGKIVLEIRDSSVETKKYLDDPCEKYPRDFDKNINLKKIEKIILDLHLN